MVKYILGNFHRNVMQTLNNILDWEEERETICVNLMKPLHSVHSSTCFSTYGGVVASLLKKEI